MKIWLISLFITLSYSQYTYAQKVSIKNWVAVTIDSLQKRHVDTIEYYHQYCGECDMAQPPGKSVSYCKTEEFWVQVENIIIYLQKGKYYSLAFNCNNPSIKKEISKVNSLSYFLSIVPVLDKRDKFGASMQKKYKFNPPIIADGTYEEAFLYCNNIKKRVFMHADQKTDKEWRKYFWIDKQTKLFSILESETLSKD